MVPFTFSLLSRVHSFSEGNTGTDHPTVSTWKILLVQMHENVDLDTRVDSFIPSTRNFTVLLHHGLGIVDSTLTKELSPGYS